MKLLVSLVLVFVVIPVAFIAWYRWDSARNRGREFGYYGDYNRVSNALASIPGVTITQSWHNLDVTLEEFGFSITFTGRPVRLAFSETDKIRDMRREEAVAVLKHLIQTELSASNTNK